MSRTVENIIIYSAVIVFLLVCAFFIFRPFQNVDIFSCEKAECAAQKYLSKHHPDSDYEINSAHYNDKDGHYFVSITSPSSQDRHFQLVYDTHGRLTHNSYQDMVEMKGSTAIRLNNEYKEAVYATFEPAAPWDDFSCIGNLYWRTSDNPPGEPYYLISDELELDAAYDLSEIGAKSGWMSVHVDVDSAEDVTIETLADILLYVRQTLDGKDLPFYHVDCILDYHNGTSSKRLRVEDFLYEDIIQADLEARLEKVATD